MTKGRKTVEVSPILESVNIFLKESTDSSDRRQGHIDVLCQVLFQSFNYGGFRYLNESEVPEGQLPGIRMSVVTGVPPSFENTDSTRVHYFTKTN